MKGPKAYLLVAEKSFLDQKGWYICQCQQKRLDQYTNVVQTGADWG